MAWPDTRYNEDRPFNQNPSTTQGETVPKTHEPDPGFTGLGDRVDSDVTIGQLLEERESLTDSSEPANTGKPLQYLAGKLFIAESVNRVLRDGSFETTAREMVFDYRNFLDDIVGDEKYIDPIKETDYVLPASSMIDYIIDIHGADVYTPGVEGELPELERRYQETVERLDSGLGEDTLRIEETPEGFRFETY